LEKHWKVKSYENPFCGEGVVPCGKSDGQTDIQKDMTKLKVACRNLASGFKYYPGIWLEGERKDTKVAVMRDDLRSYI